jgi:hypothetical protein
VDRDQDQHPTDPKRVLAVKGTPDVITRFLSRLTASGLRVLGDVAQAGRGDPGSGRGGT